MSDPLQRVVSPVVASTVLSPAAASPAAPSHTLWFIVAPPLLAFAWQLARGLRGQGAAYDPWPRRVGLGSTLLASAALLGNEFGLARTPLGTKALVETAVGGLRFDTLAFAFGLVFDRLAVAACTLACVVALAVGTLIATRRLDDRTWRPWAWLELALGGGLLSFLAGGLATTWLAWGITSAATTWLAGWTDTKAGAVRATRCALAAFGLLVGSSLLSGAADTSWSAARPFFDAVVDARTASAALVALVLAGLAMSASTPRVGAPPLVAFLGALDSGAVAGLVGPFLLLRLAALVPLSAHGAPMLIAAGAASLVFAARRARTAPAGLPRLVALAGGAPAGLTLIAISTDGAKGGSLVLVAAGMVSALLVVVAGAAPNVANAANAVPSRESFERAFLGHAPESGATLLMAFERWVVDSIAGSVTVLVRALAWTLVRFDTHVVGAPANALAARTVHVSRGLEPLVGGSLAKLAWLLVGTFALAVLAHALWPVP
jgi:hypothetical protein